MMALVITALLWEVSNYARRRSILTPTRFLWRLVGLGLLLAIFAGMFAGLYLIRFSDRLSAIRYWTAFLALSPLALFALILMAIRDWRWLMGEQMRRRMELYRQLGEELKRMAGKEPSGDGRNDG
jgi:ABC-type proline/glycine betaine transport system permease subunit